MWNVSSAESHTVSHENWDYTSRESSEYVTRFNLIHSTTRITHIPFQEIILYRYDYVTLRINSFSATMCACTKRILPLSLCSKFFTTGHSIILMLSAENSSRLFKDQRLV